MFERLGEIIENKERYLSEKDLPEVFLWFPIDKNYIGTGGLNETVEQTTERLIKRSKQIRTQLHRITSGLDAVGEERLLEYLEIRETISELSDLLKQCNVDTNQNFEKAQNAVKEVKATIEGLDFENLVHEIFIDNQFKIGVGKVLTPWIDCLEKEAFAPQTKPLTFQDAMDLEKTAVQYAKEVRKANKLLNKLDEEAGKQSNKIFSMQLIEDQKVRFRHIAQIAATRVENTRNTILKWGFFVEMKTEADSLYDTVKELYPEIQESSAKDLDESEYEEGLPLVLNKFIRRLEDISRMPVKPQNIQECSKGLESIEKLKLASKAGFGVLNKVGECTEKTPAHKPVWEQICLLKKVNTALEDQSHKLNSLLTKWRNLEKSEKEDDIDFQPLLGFLLVYSQIFAA